jgi:hypothetical protein
VEAAETVGRPAVLWEALGAREEAGKVVVREAAATVVVEWAAAVRVAGALAAAAKVAAA